MGELSNIDAVAHVIQLSVAPVFLLSGIGAMLAVMTNRLARVIDRARVLEGKLAFFLGLLWFLREIFVATRSLRIGSRHVHEGRAPR